MRRTEKKITTPQKAADWETVTPMLRAMFSEFKELSRKKPDGAVSKAKIGVVNRLLEKCRSVLANEDSLAFLDRLDEDDVPQHSDVVLMLSQYVAALEQFRSTYYGFDGMDYTWFLKKNA